MAQADISLILPPGGWEVVVKAKARAEKVGFNKSVGSKEKNYFNHVKQRTIQDMLLSLLPKLVVYKKRKLGHKSKKLHK